MKLGKQDIAIKSLIRPNWMETEMRVRINEQKVVQYSDEMLDGAIFPAPTVFIDPATELLRVGDGFHRILAHKLNKIKTIVVDLRRGGYRDAFLYGIDVNKKQLGLPFATGDKERCIMTMLNDEECKKWTMTRIAETVGCTTGYVSVVTTKFK